MSGIGDELTRSAGLGGALSRWIGGSPDRAAPAAAARLFCFAHAGGGAAFFRPWRIRLEPRIDVRPILLPGRESRIRELPYRRIQQLLDPLCAAMEPFLDRPYAVFGHSMGAVIAYEVARRFSGSWLPGPACLLMSGRRAPHLPSSRRPLSSLSDTDFLAAVRRLNGTPPEVLEQPGLVELLLPALRADFELHETYQPQPGPALTCPVGAYVGRDDPEVDDVELLRWREVTSGEFTMRVFPGDHFYLKGERPDVVSALIQDLRRVGC